ncbi:hydrogen peroxide-inducible genes activator [Rhodomicrobium lacus]|uniref:hydrogen peroxide-inducible genes activator n=1 Tax=Rhodomicrobium lacus TaxID=2498452 RepID=UPI000F8DCD7A|nr:hydrogen peroxide-inducible genes activator [Rhodomicrobium lacus]
MANISLKQLRYFDALARSLHFGRAAEACAVTQPALSMQIQELERELGAALIERTRTGAKLTREGEEAAHRVASILAAVRDLEASARQGDAPLSHALRIGVIPTVAPYMLPRLLPVLREDYPDLDVELRESQTGHLLADLAGGRLDTVLLALPVDLPDIETLPLFEDEFVFAVPESRVVPEGALASPDMFVNERILLLEEGHCLRDQALSVCSLNRAGKLDTMGTTSLSTLVQMVAGGFGVTLLPRMSLAVEARSGVRLMRFAPPVPHRTIGLAWRTSSPRKADFRELGRIVATLGAGLSQ